MKNTDEREMQKTTKEKQTKTERATGTEAISKGWELNDFVVHLVRFSPVNMWSFFNF